ncbi:hypothetical protein VTN02DRAFT_6865 [Thermoascus thermophilus]
MQIDSGTRALRFKGPAEAPAETRTTDADARILRPTRGSPRNHHAPLWRSRGPAVCPRHSRERQRPPTGGRRISGAKAGTPVRSLDPTGRRARHLSGASPAAALLLRRSGKALSRGCPPLLPRRDAALLPATVTNAPAPP